MLIALLLFLVVGIVVLILVLVKILLSDYSISSFRREEASSYECGFEQHSLSRVPLSLRYFILTLVFLIFDLEVMLLIFSPVDLITIVSKAHIILISLIFVIILFGGLLFEWYDGSLE
jgi:NADH-ubiquinone oxidoreductase chain 3